MADPLELEFQETQKYFLQIEATMHDVMKFYSTLVLGVITASIALASMVMQTGSGLPTLRSLAKINYPFTLLGAGCNSTHHGIFPA